MEIVYVTKVFLMRERDNKVLVLTRSDNKKISPGKWEYSAGGTIDPGENHENALRREMMEEINMEVGDLVLFGAEGVHNPFTGNFDVLFFHFAKTNKDVEWFNPNEVKAVDWFSIEEINALIEKHGENKFDLAYIPAFRKLEKFLKEQRCRNL